MDNNNGRDGDVSMVLGLVQKERMTPWKSICYYIHRNYGIYYAHDLPLLSIPIFDILVTLYSLHTVFAFYTYLQFESS